MTLADYLPTELIELQRTAATWQEAIRIGGNLLYQHGYCEKRYIEAMIQAVHDLGPYMVVIPGISFAHARPEDGMIRDGISLINLAQPVNFGHETNDPVSVVICFGGRNHNTHVRMLQALSSYLIEEQHQQLLKSAMEKEWLLQSIREGEE